MAVNYSLLLVSTVSGIAAVTVLASGLRPYRNRLDYRDRWLADNQ